MYFRCLKQLHIPCSNQLLDNYFKRNLLPRYWLRSTLIYGQFLLSMRLIRFRRPRRLFQHLNILDQKISNVIFQSVSITYSIYFQVNFQLSQWIDIPPTECTIRLPLSVYWTFVSQAKTLNRKSRNFLAHLVSIFSNLSYIGGNKVIESKHERQIDESSEEIWAIVMSTSFPLE